MLLQKSGEAIRGSWLKAQIHDIVKEIYGKDPEKAPKISDVAKELGRKLSAECRTKRNGSNAGKATKGRKPKLGAACAAALQQAVAAVVAGL